MASQEEHIKQAQHNESFSLSIKETPYLDWVVTGIFYSALHYIEGYLAINDGHPDIHAVRNEMIEEDPNLGWRFIAECIDICATIVMKPDIKLERLTQKKFR